MNSSNNSHYKSQALVDWSGLGKTIGDVQGSFSLLEFLDFCTVIEGIILYDELIPVGKQIPNKWEEEITLLQQHGVLSGREIQSKAADLGDRPEIRGKRNLLHRDNASYSTLIDAWYETGRLIGAETATGISSLPLLRQRPLYEKHARVREEHTFFNLISQYKELSHALQALRNSLRVTLRPYHIIPIPPVALMVMRRSQQKHEFLTRSLEVREEFSTLRSGLTELREVLDSADMTVQEKVRYRVSWMKTWGTLGKYKDSRFSFDLADAAKEKISVERSLDGIGIDSLSLTKLIELALTKSIDLFYRRRIRILHTAAKKYLQDSDGQMNGNIARLYNHQFSERDFDTLRGLGFHDDIIV